MSNPTTAGQSRRRRIAIIVTAAVVALAALGGWAAWWNLGGAETSRPLDAATVRESPELREWCYMAAETSSLPGTAAQRCRDQYGERDPHYHDTMRRERCYSAAQDLPAATAKCLQEWGPRDPYVGSTTAPR